MKIIFEKETKEEIFHFFEDVLVDDKYGKMSVANLEEDKLRMTFFDSLNNMLLDVRFPQDCDWLGLMVYVQSICDYYQRNVGQTKFICSFDEVPASS